MFIPIVYETPLFRFIDEAALDKHVEELFRVQGDGWKGIVIQQTFPQGYFFRFLAQMLVPTRNRGDDVFREPRDIAILGVLRSPPPKGMKVAYCLVAIDR